jgi:hypothetical protein
MDHSKFFPQRIHMDMIVGMTSRRELELDIEAILVDSVVVLLCNSVFAFPCDMLGADTTDMVLARKSLPVVLVLEDFVNGIPVTVAVENL